MELIDFRDSDYFRLYRFRLVRDDHNNLGVKATGEFPETNSYNFYSSEENIFVPYSKDWFEELISLFKEKLFLRLENIDRETMEQLVSFSDEDEDEGYEPSWDIGSDTCNSDGIEWEVENLVSNIKNREFDCNFTDPVEGRYYYEYRLYSLPEVKQYIEYGVA